MIVGPPTTGKSQALGECALQPLITVREARDLGNFIVERCTSSALTKCLAEQKKGFLCSPEIYDVLNKLLKSDEENGTGDVQLLCELFFRRAYIISICYRINARNLFKCTILYCRINSSTFRCSTCVPNGSRSWSARSVSSVVSSVFSSKS